MINGLGASLSGINAFQKKLDVAAGNVANAQTDGYKAKRVQLEAGADGASVVAKVETDNAPGPQAVVENGGKMETVEKSNTDLAKEMTEMLLAKRGLQANVIAARTADEMVGSLLDIKK